MRKKSSGELDGIPCDHCHASGVEPGATFVCSKCLGVQYVDANTGEAFDDFNALRFTIRLLRKKDHHIGKLKKRINRLLQQLRELKPYLDKKRFDDMIERMYPRKRTQERSANGQGGYGD